MSKKPSLVNKEITDSWILANRGSKNPVNTTKPYAFLVEKEKSGTGSVEDLATIFLTNKECPFHCLMCDLWKNTTDSKVASGEIPNQIKWALSQLPESDSVKLYNSGNFFDLHAIPKEDYRAVADLVTNFKTIIVESHPKLINERCLEFRDMLKGSLEIAIGLETVHPDILPKLNKRMSLDDFRVSVNFLRQNQISVRAFILLRPPFMTEEEGIIWAKKSIDYAFECGVKCCTVIPTREGNGAIDELATLGQFTQPTINSLEEVLNYGISLNMGRVFADTWDIEKFSTCPDCLEIRKERIGEMNLMQKILPTITCDSCR